MISLIVIMDRNRVIGRDNRLPWHLPADLKHFKSLTMGHHIIMGRKTFESVGRPLPGRVNVVITRSADYAPDGAVVVHSLEEALEVARGDHEPFVIGGAEIFRQALPIADRLYVTEIHHEFEGETFFPQFSSDEWKVVSRDDHEPDEKNRYRYSFLTYERIARS